MSKVLVISPDAVPVGGALAAGPGIRYFELAAALGRRGHSVTLAAPAETFTPGEAPVALAAWRFDNIRSLAESHDCVVISPVNSRLSSLYPETVDPGLPTAVDLYDPVLIENLGLQPANAQGVAAFANYLAGVVPILKRGDFFFCANERQRLYYLGVLNVLGRINPLTYSEPPIGLVPFGVNKEPARHVKRVMRGSLVPEDAKVILWFSGIYPWFDARTLVEAMPAVLERLPAARLVIMGGVHPREHAPDTEFQATKAVAGALGLTDGQVVFTDWQPYAERANWYLEADVAVTLHKQSLETELSHRTRVVDFVWAGLPMIVSAGDEIGAAVAAAGCGLTVPVGDKEQLAAALIEVLADDGRRRRMSRAAGKLASALSWDAVIKPLADWCDRPGLAKDRADDFARRTVLTVIGTHAGNKEAAGGGAEIGLLARARARLDTEGLPGVVKGVGRVIGRKLKGRST